MMKIPTVSEYFSWKSSGKNIEVIAEIDRIRESNPDLEMPYYPEKSDYIRHFSCNTQDIKMVADYSNMGFTEVLTLDIFTYWAWLHDSVVWDCEKSEDGRNYLEKAWAGSQKEPDREAIRAIFG